MRLLVTGAAGFIGYYIASALAADPDNSVICVDNFIRGVADEEYRGLLALPNVETYEIDLCDQAAVRTLPLDVDVIFHMAALNGTQNFYERPFEVVRCCTLPTIFLLEHYRASPTKPRFVYAGTSEAYASTVTRFDWPVPTAEDVPLSIDDPANARWSYGASKMHGEIATINGCRSVGMPYTIIRYHNAYGPRMGDKHVIPDFLERAKHGRYILYGGGDTRSFIYVTDAAAATIALALNAAANGETFNIGGTEEITMVELAKSMMAVIGATGELKVEASPSGSVARRCPDVSKATSVIGPFNLVGLQQGLHETASYYLTK
jgi:nucleoside-diphosphate-sugar epimerase